jgi:hypothetical protein
MRINGSNNYYNNSKPNEFMKQEALPKNAPEDSPKIKPEIFPKAMLDLYAGISNEGADGEKDQLKIHIMCLEISRRIISGDKVPQSDYDFLLENDPEMFARSIAMRILKENPKEYESLSEKAEKEDSLNSVIEEIAGNLSQSISSGTFPSPEIAMAGLDITI